MTTSETPGQGSVDIPLGLLPAIIVALYDVEVALAECQREEGDDLDEQCLALRGDIAHLLAELLAPPYLPPGRLSLEDLIARCREAPDLLALSVIDRLLLALLDASDLVGDNALFNEGGKCFEYRQAGSAYLDATWYPYLAAFEWWATAKAQAFSELLERGDRVLRPYTEQRELYGEVAAAHDALGEVLARLRSALAEGWQDEQAAPRALLERFLRNRGLVAGRQDEQAAPPPQG